MSFVQKNLVLNGSTFAVRDTGTSRFPIVMLHGSGATGAVFSAQFESPLTGQFRLIAIDLPGHGKSSRFAEPQTDYILPALAQCIAGLFGPLGIDRAIVLGWSLGGHIALELMAQCPERLAGVMISGTPPLANGSFDSLRAFHLNPTSLLAGKRNLSANDAARLVRLFYGPAGTDQHIEAILDTDPAFRAVIMSSILRGDGANQKQLVARSPVPLAVVNGADDPAIRPGYIAGLDFGNLWEGKCHLIAGCGHAPFLAAPNRFNALLHRFATGATMSQQQPVVPAAAQTTRAVRN